MNLLEEESKYHKTNNKGVQVINPYIAEFKGNLELSVQLEREKDIAYDNLQDKLKTTPSAGLTMIGKKFRVDWGKVFKRGWLLWK